MKPLDDLSSWSVLMTAENAARELKLADESTHQLGRDVRKYNTKTVCSNVSSNGE